MPAPAQSAAPVHACVAIADDAQRLACYDHAAGHTPTPAAQPETTSIAPKNAVSSRIPAAPANAEIAVKTSSLLDTRWELSPENKQGTFKLRADQPLTIMPVYASSNQNRQPTSLNPRNTVDSPQALHNVESKFQLSLKTKLWQNIFGENGDLWVSYTQSSYWQIYNAKASRPFRETDYEPQLLLVFDTHYQLAGWDGRMLGLALDHQSNGRGDPLSRSWNRLMGYVGFERGDWVVMVRPWWRISESRANDDNPHISDYMGRADVRITREWHGQEFTLMLRHSLRTGSNSRGAGQLTWSYPIHGQLHGYVELFKGYGENLIDYNHNATYLGVGLSLLNWY